LLVLRDQVSEVVLLNARVDAALAIDRCAGVPKHIDKGIRQRNGIALKSTLFGMKKVLSIGSRSRQIAADRFGGR